MVVLVIQSHFVARLLFFGTHSGDPRRLFLPARAVSPLWHEGAHIFSKVEPVADLCYLTKTVADICHFKSHRWRQKEKE